MTNEQMAARLEDMATDLVCFGIPESDQIALRAGAEALRVMDEEDGPVIDPLQCGTFNDQTPTGPVVRVGRDLWKQIRDEKAAALREVERMRGALRSINRIDENGNAVLKGWSEIDDIVRAALSGIDTPGPRDEALEKAEKALEKVESYLNRVNHVYLLDGSILYASEVFDALAAIRAAKGGK